MTLNKFSFLELTNYPITNFQADLFKDLDWFKDKASRSHFYMICSRPKITFAHVPNNELNAINNMEMFEVSSGPDLKDSFIINPEVIPQIQKLSENDPYYLIKEGPVLALSKRPYIKTYGDLHKDWTIQKILWERSREEPWVVGFDKFREFMTFELLYVGIAPSTNTLSRLIQGGHHARQKILSREYPKEYGTRVTDEVHMLMFEINPVLLQQLADDEDTLSDIFLNGYEDAPIIKDAEKAFIHLLRPKYNEEKYDKYPAGSDGVYSEGYNGYSYSISENLTLNTPNGPFIGARSPLGGWFSDDADIISVVGDNVEIINYRKTDEP